MKAVLVLTALIGLSTAAPQFLNPQAQQGFGQLQQQQQQTSQNEAFGGFSNTVQSFSQGLEEYLARARQAVILRNEYQQGAPGFYRFDVDTSDDFHHKQAGVIENEGTDDESLGVAGEYSYIGPDGQEYKVFYTADKNGFQPAGEHIPPAASTRKKPQLGIPSAALASLAGGGLG